MKRLLCSFLSTCILLSCSTVVIAERPNKFRDVPSYHWAYTQIMDMSNRGIILGDSYGNFNPENSISRAEFATIMVRAAGLTPSQQNTLAFSDVKPTDWFASYIEAAKSYLTGFSNNSTGESKYFPNDPAVREDIAIALIKLKGISVSNLSDYGSISYFKDYKEISDVAKPYIEAAVLNNLMSGYPDGTFKPQGHLTRAEAAKLLYSVILDYNYSKILLDGGVTPTITPTSTPTPTAESTQAQKLSVSEVLNLANNYFTKKLGYGLQYAGKESQTGSYIINWSNVDGEIITNYYINPYSGEIYDSNHEIIGNILNSKTNSQTPSVTPSTMPSDETEDVSYKYTVDTLIGGIGKGDTEGSQYQAKIDVVKDMIVKDDNIYAIEGNNVSYFDIQSTPRTKQKIANCATLENGTDYRTKLTTKFKQLIYNTKNNKLYLTSSQNYEEWSGYSPSSTKYIDYCNIDCLDLNYKGVLSGNDLLKSGNLLFNFVYKYYRSGSVIENKPADINFEYTFPSGKYINYIQNSTLYKIDSTLKSTKTPETVDLSSLNLKGKIAAFSTFDSTGNEDSYYLFNTDNNTLYKIQVFPRNITEVVSFGKSIKFDDVEVCNGKFYLSRGMSVNELDTKGNLKTLISEGDLKFDSTPSTRMEHINLDSNGNIIYYDTNNYSIRRINVFQ